MVPQRPRCAYLSPNGAGCLAYATKDSSFCFFYDPSPETAAKRKQSLAKASKKSASHDGLESWAPRSINSATKLKKALSELFNAGMSGDITTARLSAMASVANALGKVIVQSDLEARIEALEKMAREAKK